MALALSWTAAVAVSLIWNLHLNRRETIVIATYVAQTHIDKDILYREWNAGHGGVYAPVTDETLPNVHLAPKLVAERDIATPAGRPLTLVNPAYMTRQVYQLSQLRGEPIAGRITSLKPLRPANQADTWETEALHAFENGRHEYRSLIEVGGRSYLRLMRPLVTRRECLPCHEAQGYREGDIRGGIGVTLPMERFEAALGNRSRSLVANHFFFWLLGLLGIAGGFLGLRQRLGEIERADAELSRLNAILQEQSIRDGLTGLFNYRHFQELLQRDFLLARRHGADLACLMLDLDHFKEVNDTCGHQFGDSVLRKFARLLSDLSRETDAIARYGGEEFVILLHNTDRAGAMVIAERIRVEAGMADYEEGGHRRRVTVSIGIATMGGNGPGKAEELVALADEALYVAKAAGRNRIAEARKQGGDSPVVSPGG